MSTWGRLTETEKHDVIVRGLEMAFNRAIEANTERSARRAAIIAKAIARVKERKNGR